MEYKEWHDAEGVFHSQRRIYFSAANANKILSLHELVKIAVEDYRTRGMSREFLTRAKSHERCTQTGGLRTMLGNKPQNLFGNETQAASLPPGLASGRKVSPCENSFIRA